MHSDPIADMLTRLNNAKRVGLKTIVMPSSKLKAKILDILCREGFVKSYRQLTRQHLHDLEVELRYGERNQPVLKGIRRFSRPGLRRYFAWDKIPEIRSGLGLVILSTSVGLMTDKEARRARIGGEALCSVW